jgi:pimeloyl-ACP methyl ester carboxylesterase
VVACRGGRGDSRARLQTRQVDCMHRIPTQLALTCVASAAEAANEAKVNGVRLSYVTQGSGEPMVFVHGLLTDLRTWQPVSDEIAKRFWLIAYTQRYFGTGPWNDGGAQFSVATHADDLAKFIVSLNAGPVHLVGWSYGGQVATVAAIKNPGLIRSLILYEATVMSALPEASIAGKTAREDRAKMLAPASAAIKAADTIKATRLLWESIWQLAPGGSYREPQAWQTMFDENARTLSVALAAPRPPDVTCDMLKNFRRPTFVMRGQKTHSAYVLINEAISKCVPGADQVILPGVNHDGPLRDPKHFSAAIFKFLSKVK